jgi:hypothetical protein
MFGSLRFWRFLLWLAVPGLLLVPGTWLVVERAEDGTVIWARPIREGERVYLRYTHSVTRRQVEDTYKVAGGSLVLTATRFEALGAGLGYTGEGTVRVESGWTVIEGMERRVPKLPLRVGAVADHRLAYRGKEFHLWDYAPPYSLVYIRPCRMSLGRFILARLLFLSSGGD